MVDPKTRKTRSLESKETICRDSEYDTMQIIFRRALAAILGSRNISCKSDAFEFLAMLTEQRKFSPKASIVELVLIAFCLDMIELYARLHKLTQVQRRLQPTVQDLSILIKSTGIKLTELEKEMKLRSRFTEALNRLQINIDLEPMSDSAKSFFVSQDGASRRLFPATKRRANFIPSWMPSFPPDHTFMSTPQYPRRVVDPRDLRERIVEEGRLAEMALRRLTGIVQVDENLHEEENDEVENEEDNELVEVEFENELELEQHDSLTEQAQNIDEAGSEGGSEAEFEDVSMLDVSGIKEGENPSKNATDNLELKIPLDTSVSLDKAQDTSVSLRENQVKAEVSAPPERESVLDTKTDENVVVPIFSEIHEDKTTEVKENLEKQPKSLKPLSLKISLGGKPLFLTKPSQSENTNAASTNNTITIVKPKTTTMTAAERNKYDPFSVKTTSKKFDIMSYMKKRKQIVEKRQRKKEQRDHEKNTAEQESRNIMRRPENIKKRDGDLINHEYSLVFASIQRAKDKKGDGNKVMDLGVINCDRQRYIL